MTARLLLAAALLASSAAQAQETIRTPGMVEHRAARTGFPDRIGEFRRSSATRYDAEGRNVSASYDLDRPDGRLLITVYIYPAARVGAGPGSGESAEVARAMLCRREFESVQEAITSQHRDAEEVRHDGPLAVAGARPPLSHRAAYRFRAQFQSSGLTSLQEVRSEARLYCYVGGDWLVKYRITAPANLDVDDDVEAFIRAGPWPRGETVALPAAVEPAP